MHFLKVILFLLLVPLLLLILSIYSVDAKVREDRFIRQEKQRLGQLQRLTVTPILALSPTINFSLISSEKPKTTSTPTKRPVSSPVRIPIPTKTGSHAPSQTTDLSVYLLDRVNEYRKSQGLSAVTSDPYTCGFAKVRAKEISTSFNHDGFSNRIDNKTLPYPSYNAVIENIAMTPSYSDVVTMWINSPGHAARMRANTSYVCIGNYGNYYAYEGWLP